MSDNIKSKKWYKSLSALSSVVVTVAVIAWNWNVIKTHIFSDDSALVETTTSELLEESLGKNDDLKKFARVCEIKETRLVKEGSGNSYTGYAKVVMQVRTKDSTDEHIKYGGNPITVSYSLKVLYDGRNVMLNDAEMEDADLAKLLKAAGVSDADEDADENEAATNDGKTTAENGTATQLDVADFIKKQPSMTKLQWKRFVDGNAGKSIVLRDCNVTGVEEDEDNENAVIMTIVMPDADFFMIEANVTNPKMVALAAKMSPGTKIGMVIGTLKKLDADSYPMVALQIANTQIVKVESAKTSHVVKHTESMVADKLLSMMDESSKLTMDAVGWARDPLTEEQKRAFHEKIAAMSEQEQTALLEQFKTEHENLKQFIEIVSIVDSYLKQIGASPLMNKDIVREFLTLTPESQKEHLEKLRAKVEEIKRKAGKTEMSATKEMTGADIVREFEKKPKGYSAAQIEDLQKKLAGRVLIFENGEVSRVARNMDGRLNIVAHFGKINRNLRRFSINAYFPRSDAARLIKVLDEGAHIKSLEGRVDGSEECLDSVHITEMLTLTDAKIIISE